MIWMDLPMSKIWKNPASQTRFPKAPASGSTPKAALRVASAALLLTCFPAALRPQAPPAAVQFTHGKRTVPTYTFGRGETVAPLFKPLEDVGHYPYTRLDWDSQVSKPVPVDYESLVLENEYLRVEFLPELGGRVFSVRDKIAKRELFYLTTVIKPGRYNQRGAWPVGNLEVYGPFDAHMLTWPGEPWSWAMRRHADGSASVVLTHIDHFFRNKVTLEVTVHPGRAYMETSVRLHNRNLYPNRYLLWTNGGVAVTEGSRFVYPMTRTIGHDSSALGGWPMINGVDMSWNRNNRNMLGVFGLDIFDNYMSIYDYKTDYGTFCYTNRLLARGMKTWTFGSGLTALRHMAAYTDSDGLYMETQSGRFIWDGNYEMIEPGKSDGWTEFWFGAGKLGGLTTATRDAVLFWDIPAQRPGVSKVSLTATGSFPQAQIEVKSGEKVLWTARRNLSFGQVVKEEVQVPSADPGNVLSLRVKSQGGKLLLEYSDYPPASHPNAEYASDSIPRRWGPPEGLTAEECYQKGLAHEKFGQITDAETAYTEALSKDAGLSTAHLRLGILALDRFDQDSALKSFLKVLDRDPTNGDAHYLLSLLYAARGELLQARRHAYRLLPSEEKYHRRDYLLALIALQEGSLPEAGEKLKTAMQVTGHDLSVRQAWAWWLRRQGRGAEAARETAAILDQDPTSAFARAEELRAAPAGSPAARQAGGLLDRACVHHPQGYLELATEYMKLSAWEEAGWVLDRGIADAEARKKDPDPMLLYHRAFAAARTGNADVARRNRERAAGMDLQLEIFPFRAEDVGALRASFSANPKDANAAVLLGDLLYSRGRRDEAIALWRQAVDAQPRHFAALRDLGLGLMAQEGSSDGLALLSRAVDVKPSHSATVILVANLNARAGNPQAARATFERALAVNPGKDPLIERLSGVEMQLKNPEKALEILEKHTFQPTHQVYTLLHLYRAIRLSLAGRAAADGRFDQALEHVRIASNPPASLGIDDFATVKSSRLLMFEALLHEARGNREGAQRAWREAAATGDDDIEGEGLFRAVAIYKLGDRAKAEAWFKEFEPVNEQRKKDSSLDIRTHAFSVAGFYDVFRGNTAAAQANFQHSIEVNHAYAYGRQALDWLAAGLLKPLTR
jgi:tetratricopeptide (TPR) repeat protein